MNKDKNPVVTILSTADMDNPVWTNKQHLAAGLAEQLHVNYINSMGLRAPSVSVADIQRLAKRFADLSLKSKNRNTSIRNPNINVLSPRVLPFHRSGLVRSLNRRSFGSQISKSISVIDRDILWTFSPLTYGLSGSFRRTVYHSVDLLHTFPGVPVNVILDAEKRMIDTADVIIASSRGVAKHLESLGGESILLWENVADTKLYAESANADPVRRAIFSGNLTPTKIDFDVLRSVAETGIKLALAGPVAIDGTAGQRTLARLLEFENVEYLGCLTPPELAIEVGNSTVGLIPYHINAHTAGIFPMKVFEYLSAGLSVVSTALPSLVQRPEILGLTVASRGDFATSVLRENGDFRSSLARQRREAAIPFSWANRLVEARALTDRLYRGESA